MTRMRKLSVAIALAGASLVVSGVHAHRTLTAQQPQETILTDRQLRQRLSFSLARQRAVLDAARAAYAHDSIAHAAIHARITRDSIAAITPTIDSIAVYPGAIDIEVGDTLQLCAFSYYSNGTITNSCTQPPVPRNLPMARDRVAPVKIAT